MDNNALAFAPATFDVVLCRLARFWPDQGVRVLRPGGYFVCQQVGGDMNRLIRDAFGWGTNGGYWQEVFAAQGDPLPGMDEYAALFVDLGCQVVARDTSTTERGSATSSPSCSI